MQALIFIIELLIISFFSLFSITLGDETPPPPPVIKETKPRAIKSIAHLTYEEIREYCKHNPCYLPLLKDSTLWQPGQRVGFEYEDLFNDSLPKDHPFRNRYLVGDFNVLDENGENKTIREVFPSLLTLEEFEHIPRDLLEQMDTVPFGSEAYESVLRDLRTRMTDSAEYYIQFLETVWRYRMIPLQREYSILGNTLYAGGQSVTMCEACGDTLVMIGKFSVSAKRQTVSTEKDENGKEYQKYSEHFPTGRWRNYYAGLNRISSKNWESGRPYRKYEIERDKALGGGNSRITMYKDKVELSNFLLIEPSDEYPEAMHRNGLHEVALVGLARGMLGTANSIGCIRVTDFGAKFLRWWVPQNCNFFIVYADKRYHKPINDSLAVLRYLPFRTKYEGDRFRQWINRTHPREADILEIWETGDYRNGYILDAYFYFEREYKEYLKNPGVIRRRGQAVTGPVPTMMPNIFYKNLDHCKLIK